MDPDAVQSLSPLHSTYNYSYFKTGDSSGLARSGRGSGSGLPPLVDDKVDNVASQPLQQHEQHSQPLRYEYE
jgi:hypothetical protein